MMLLWLLLFWGEDGESLRHQTQLKMGLDKPFAAYTLKTSSSLTLGDREFTHHSMERVDARMPRFVHGPESSPSMAGFDGQKTWTSKTIESLRPEGSKKLDDEALRKRAKHQWWSYLPILLTDAHLKPELFEDGEQTGLRFFSPDDQTLLAEIFIANDLPVRGLFYEMPKTEDGEQRITTVTYADFRTVKGRFMPYAFSVKDSIFDKKAKEPVALKQTAVFWTFHDKLEPSWFLPPTEP